MAKGLFARQPRIASSFPTKANLKPEDRVRKAAHFAVEALEARQLLTAYTWNNPSATSPSWSTGTSWSPSTGYPGSGSSSDSANLNTNITVNQSISLGANVSIASLTLGDSTLTGGVGQTETIAAGNTLAFNNGSSAATLTLASGAVAGVSIAAPITLSSNLTITNSSSQTLTISGNIDTAGYSIIVNGGNVVISGIVGNSTGSGSVTDAGATLTLSGSNTYSGGTTVSSGMLVAGANSAFGTGTVNMTGGNVNDSVAGLTISNPIYLTSSSCGSIEPAYSITLGGVISGPGPLVDSGAGLLTLQGANTYTGGTTINNGEISVGTNTAFGTGTVTNSAAIGDSTTGLTLANPIYLSGCGAGSFVLPNSLTLSGAISGSGPLTLSGGSGSVALTLNAADNSYTGAITVSEGQLAAGANNAFTTSGGLSIANSSSASVNLNGKNISVGSLSGGGSSGGNITGLSGTFTVGSAGTSTTYSGTISGTGGTLTKSGYGTLTLTGSNSYTGGTTLNSGGLILGSNTALGTGTVSVSGTLGDTTSGLTISNPIYLTTSACGGISPPYAITLSGVISGPGSLVDTGAGLLTLQGSNTYTGGTTINSGQINVGSNTAFGTGTVTDNAAIGDSTTGLTIANPIYLSGCGGGSFVLPNSLTLSGAISGSGPLTLSGSSGSVALTLNAADNSYTGAVTVSEGQLVAGANNAFSTTGALSIANSSLASVNLNGMNVSVGSLSGGGSSGGNITGLTGNFTVGSSGSSTTYAGSISGSGGTVTKSGYGTLTLTGASSYTGGTTISAGEVIVGTNNALGTGTVTVSGTLSNSTSGLTISNPIYLATSACGGISPAYSITLAGAITGPGALMLASSSSVALTLTSTANAYTGGTQVYGGQLVAGANGAFPANCALYLSNTSSASLNLNGFNASFGSISGGGTSGGNITGLNGTLTVGSANTSTTYSGIISGTGNLAKTGSGTLTLAGVNTYSGGTVINGGQVLASNNGALGTGTITVNSGSLGFGGSMALANPIYLGTSLAINGTVTLSGAITGPGSLVLQSGTVTLSSNSSTYSGGTTINSGSTLVPNANNALGTGTVTMSGGMFTTTTTGLSLANPVYLQATSCIIVDSTGTLSLTGAITGPGALMTTSGTLTLGSTANAYSGGTQVYGGQLVAGTNNAFPTNTALTISNSSSASVNLNGQSVTIGSLSGGGTFGGNITGLNGTLTVGSANTSTTYSGTIAGSGNLTKTGTGTLTLSGPSTYTGATTINGGAITITANSTGSTGPLGVNSAVVMANISGATLNINANETIGSLTGGGSSGGNVVITAGNTLTVGSNNTSPAAFAGVISQTGSSASLTKVGSGSLTLAGANTYSGSTTVNAGTLLLTNTSGSGTGTGSVTVASGATLGGTGTESGSVTVNSGGILAPGIGGAPGIINTGNLTLSSGSNLDCVINSSTVGTGYSQVNVAGTVSVSGAYLNLTGSRNSYPGDILKLINNGGAGAITGTLYNIAQGAHLTVNGVTYVLSYTGGSGHSLTVTDYTPPVATNDNYTTVENQTLSVNAASGVLSNDTGSNLYVYSINAQTSYVGTQIATAGGLLTLNSNGSFTYIPNAGYVGTDAMTVYLVSDGVNQSTTAAGLQFVVTDAPLTSTGVNVSANTNIATGSVSVANFTDTAYPSGGASASGYTASINWGDGTSPTGGSIATSGSGFLVTAGPHTYATTGSFTVTTTINDTGGATKTATSTATVTLLTPPTPAAPSASLSGSSIALTWSADLNAASYTLLRSDNGGTFAALSSGITGTSFTDSTVVATDSYAYELTATDASGTSSASTASGALAPIPVAPSSLTVTAATSSSLIFGWTPPAGATGYIVDREAPGETSYSQIGTSSTASYSDTSLSPNEPYNYIVFATDTGGTSLASSALSATTLPGIPTGLAATDGDTQITLNWSAPTGGADSYNVYRYNGSTYVQINTAPVTATTYADTGLTDGTTYSYEVSAVNTGGEGALSSSVGGTTMPTAPTGLTATPGDTQASLSWTASTGAMSYNIYQYNGIGYANITSTSAVTFASATSATITGLTNGTSYSYEVSAVNAGGEGGLSTSVSVTPAVSTIESVTATAVSTSEIDLSWNLTTIGAQLIDVDYSLDGTNWSTVTLAGTATSYADTGLGADSPYFYKLQATFPDGSQSPFTTPVVASTLGAVSGLTATAASASEIDLSWNLNIPDAIAIEIDRSTDGINFTPLTTTLDPTTTTYSDTGLSEGTHYFYQVQAIGWGDAQGASSADTTTLAAVDSLAATAASTSEIDLSWNLNIPTTDVSGFEIDVSTDGGTTFTPISNTLPGTATNFADTGLADDTDYTYQVRAILAAGGDSAYTAVADATTVGAIDGLTATTVNTGEIDLGWTPNVTDLGIISVLRYTYPADGGGGTPTYTFLTDSALDPAAFTATGFRDTSVTEGNDYSYEVQAAGYNPSNSADASTAPIQNFNYTPTTTTEVLTWSNLATNATSIEIDRAPVGTTNYTAISTALSGSATTYTDNTVSENTEYLYQVKITEPSGPTTCGPLDTWTLPPAPENLQVVGDTPTEVDLTWLNLGSSSTQFDIERSNDNGASYATVAETNAGANSFADTTVVDGVSYVYVVAAVNVAQVVANPAVAPVVAFTPPIAPTGLTVLQNGDTEMDLSWTDTSPAVAGYVVQRKTGNGAWVTIATTNGPYTTRYSDRATALATQYSYQVFSTDKAGHQSSPSNVVTAATAPSFGLSPNNAATATLGDPNSDQILDTYTLQTTSSFAAGQMDPITSWDIDWGDGTAGVAEGDPRSIPHTYTAAGNFSITAYASTAAGPTSQDPVTWSVNVPVPVPTLVISANTLVAQGDNVILTRDYTPHGAGDDDQYIVDWGDGTANGSSFVHTYAHGGTTYEIDVFVVTSVGVVGAQTSVEVTGSNPYSAGTYSTNYGLSDQTVERAPAITGDTIQADVTALFDPLYPNGGSSGGGSGSCGAGCCAAGGTGGSNGSGGTYNPESETYALNWGDAQSSGGDLDNFTSSDSSSQVNHVYGQDGQYLTSLTATDGTALTQFESVINSTPSLVAPSEQIAAAGQPVTFSTSFSNMGAELNPYAFVDWGDGTGPHQLSIYLDGAGTGEIFSNVPAPSTTGVYNATITLYPMGPTAAGPGGDGTYKVTTTFKLDVWNVVIDHGESNDVLVASSDGTQNLQPVIFNFPHPAGQSIDLSISSSDAADIQLWAVNNPTAGVTPVIIGPGSGYPISYPITTASGINSQTFYCGAIAGNVTLGKLSFTEDITTSPWTFSTVSQKASLLGLSLSLQSNPNSVQPGAADVTNKTTPWLVGQSADLKAVVTAPATILARLHYSWDVPGSALFDYTDSNAETVRTDLKPSNKAGIGTSQSESKFFWISSSAQGGALNAVDVNLLGVPYQDEDDDDVSAQTTFNLYEPTVAMKNLDVGTIQPIDFQGHAVYQLTGGPNTGNGIAYSGTVSLPPAPAFAATAPGKWKFLQTGVFQTSYTPLGVNRATLYQNSNGVALDLNDPYAISGTPPADPFGGRWHFALNLGNVNIFATDGNEQRMADNPGLEVQGVSNASKHVDFQTYMMYQPSGGVFVPVAETTWTIAMAGTQINQPRGAPVNPNPVQAIFQRFPLTVQVNPQPTAPVLVNILAPEWHQNIVSSRNPAPTRQP